MVFFFFNAMQISTVHNNSLKKKLCKFQHFYDIECTFCAIPRCKCAQSPAYEKRKISFLEIVLSGARKTEKTIRNLIFTTIFGRSGERPNYD